LRQAIAGTRAALRFRTELALNSLRIRSFFPDV
jgi:hypothetical protein